MPLSSRRSKTVKKLLIHWLALAADVLARGAEEHVAVGGCPGVH